jgi:chromosome segregation ATPase
MGDTKHNNSVLTSIGFVLAIAVAVGWYADRRALSRALEEARAEHASAVAKLDEATKALPDSIPALPSVQVGRASALPETEDTPGELESVRSELSSTRTELTATKQALSDSDDTRIEVGRKLQECQASLNQLQAAR